MSTKCIWNLGKVYIGFEYCIDLSQRKEKKMNFNLEFEHVFLREQVQSSVQKSAPVY